MAGDVATLEPEAVERTPRATRQRRGCRILHENETSEPTIRSHSYLLLRPVVYSYPLSHERLPQRGCDRFSVGGCHLAGPTEMLTSVHGARNGSRSFL